MIIQHQWNCNEGHTTTTWMNCNEGHMTITGGILGSHDISQNSTDRCIFSCNCQMEAHVITILAVSTLNLTVQILFVFITPYTDSWFVWLFKFFHLFICTFIFKVWKILFMKIKYLECTCFFNKQIKTINKCIADRNMKKPSRNYHTTSHILKIKFTHRNIIQTG